MEQVGDARALAKHMVAAVENASPQFVLVDEISNGEQSRAARTIAGRGVRLVASVHGTSIAYPPSPLL